MRYIELLYPNDDYHTLSDRDLMLVEHQLGRFPRGALQVAFRCACFAPAVVVTSPLIEVKQVKQGSITKRQPFPTLFYLTLPSIVKAVSRLEAAGVMEQMNSELSNSDVLRQKYEQAHKDYLAMRKSLMSVPQIENFSAGGMPNRIKCLHALTAHSLAVGEGINPFGDMALQLIKDDYTTAKCSCKQPYDAHLLERDVYSSKGA
jgi:hypothetical protein